jgi:diadenosine tetraphosphate (Ap4A) HIT family hydrolase
VRWQPPEAWTKLKAGIDCPMCADLHVDENPFSFKVAELRQSFVRLPKNQSMRGWTIVALKRHASELFELGEQELSDFWQDVAQVARALDQIYQTIPTSPSICMRRKLFFRRQNIG